jgi:hypothetical protein
MNSHIWALRQHNERILDHAPASAALRWGLKTKSQDPTKYFYAALDAAFFMFEILYFKTPLQRCRTKGMGTGADGTLFERPNVHGINNCVVRLIYKNKGGAPWLQ